MKTKTLSQLIKAVEIVRKEAIRRIEKSVKENNGTLKFYANYFIGTSNCEDIFVFGNKLGGFGVSGEDVETSVVSTCSLDEMMTDDLLVILRELKEK
jgi:hypothetical protein